MHLVIIVLTSLFPPIPIPDCDPVEGFGIILVRYVSLTPSTGHMPPVSGYWKRQRKDRQERRNPLRKTWD